MNRRGFTLVELLVALVLLGIVSGAIYQLLVTNQRLYQEQTQRVDLNSNLRAAVTILPTEFRELSAGDPLGSDIVEMGADSIVYRAQRALYTVCLPPVVSTATTGSITIRTGRWYGIRPFDGKRDGLMLFAEGDPSMRGDNVWLHAEPSGSITVGTACPPTMEESWTFNIKNVSPAGALAGVEVGAPLRAYEIVKMKSYQDSYGDYWVGMQRLSLPTGWGSLEPMLGPIAERGIQFAYFDTTGTVTADRTQVARIEITVIGKTRAPSAGRGHIMDTLVTHVALRNNPRP